MDWFLYDRDHNHERVRPFLYKFGAAGESFVKIFQIVLKEDIQGDCITNSSKILMFYVPVMVIMQSL